MKTVKIPEDEFKLILSKLKKFEKNLQRLFTNRNKIFQYRFNDIKNGEIRGKTEKQLDEYLKKRGIKID